ncbi:BON domain-containing protein [Rhizobium sp. NFR03]|uniref:BON domain-containing protein n=1 Tax=Rhizobium sp. NFR03 TaxID=1566263 RepID=UPI0008B998D1|nr:BON domain-containing protein [Rhizobium sp. NFR03]SER87043.1 BON domain-containing protein [Rhizobium sp. NFR03]
MPMDKQMYCRRDDEPHLRDDDLAGKVSRYIQYVALVDTTNLNVIAIGRTIILSGFVSNEAEVGCVEQAAASVIGVHLVENNVSVRHH